MVIKRSVIASARIDRAGYHAAEMARHVMAVAAVTRTVDTTTTDA